MDRKAGVLLPVSALPSEEGVGTFGPGAYAFVDFLASCGVAVWQVLPLTPTLDGNSPYQSVAALAFDPLYIDLYELIEKGLLQKEELPPYSTDKVHYDFMKKEKARLLRLAFSRFDKNDPAFVAFEEKGEYRAYATFCALLSAFDGKLFYEWPDGYDVYDEKRTEEFVATHKDDYLYYVFTQYFAHTEWMRLKEYANEKGVEILGDAPIYLALNSVEVYTHPEMFMLGEDRKPTLVAGCPPDYFNEDGQLWGNPLYDWEQMKSNGYAWWPERLHRSFEIFDILRIDHFRGLDRFFTIESGAPNARNGKWMQGPGAALFEGFEHAPIVAEDLGFVDDSLREMMRKTGYPGMKVFEFGLDGDPWNEHKPSNYVENAVAYTGTHDNMPFKGHLDELKGSQRKTAVSDIETQARIFSVRPRLNNNVSLTKTAIETLFASRARLAVCPMQDLLALGKESRMNTPALVSDDNWAWRLDKKLLTSGLKNWIKRILIETCRADKTNA